MPEYANLQCEKRPEAPLNNPSARHIPYAMAYVRPQEWEMPLRAQEALARGTAFLSLVKPFEVKGVAR